MLTSFMPCLGNLNEISCLCLDKWGLTCWLLVYFLKHDPWVGSHVSLALLVHKRSKDPLRDFVCLFVYLGPWSNPIDPWTPFKPMLVLLIPHPFVLCFDVYVDCVYFGVSVDYVACHWCSIQWTFKIWSKPKVFPPPWGLSFHL